MPNFRRSLIQLLSWKCPSTWRIWRQLVGWLVGWLVGFLPLCCMLHAQHNSMCGACTFYLFSSGVQNSLWVSEMCCWSWGWQFTWTIIKRRKARFIVHLQDRFLYNFFLCVFYLKWFSLITRRSAHFFGSHCQGAFQHLQGDSNVSFEDQARETPQELENCWRMRAFLP